MKLENKEAVCNWVNSNTKQTISKYSDIIKPKTVEIPIYESTIKKVALSILQFIFYKKAFQYTPKTKKISAIDFSKFIPPDRWISYELNSKMIAFPEFVSEYPYFWEVLLADDFFKEDLQYGIRPINTYRNRQRIGGGPLLIDKENLNIYNIGSGIWAHCDYVKDFELYKQGHQTILDWSSPPDVRR